jgi:hypothetical protein
MPVKKKPVSRAVKTIRLELHLTPKLSKALSAAARDSQRTRAGYVRDLLVKALLQPRLPHT